MTADYEELCPYGRGRVEILRETEPTSSHNNLLPPQAGGDRQQLVEADREATFEGELKKLFSYWNSHCNYPMFQ